MFRSNVLDIIEIEATQITKKITDSTTEVLASTKMRDINDYYLPWLRVVT